VLGNEEKYEEIKMNFEGAYLGNSLMDSAQIWNQRCPTSTEFTQKNLCVSVQGVLNYRCVYFTSVKYTLVCCAPGFLGLYETLPCVLILLLPEK